MRSPRYPSTPSVCRAPGDVFDLESRIKRKVEMPKLPVNAFCLSGTGRCL